MLMCVLLGAMSTGLPFMLAVFPIHAWRWAVGLPSAFFLWGASAAHGQGRSSGHCQGIMQWQSCPLWEWLLSAAASKRR